MRKLWTELRDALTPKLNTTDCAWFGARTTLERMVGPWAKRNDNEAGGFIDPSYCPRDPDELLEALDGWIEHQRTVEQDVMLAHARRAYGDVNDAVLDSMTSWFARDKRALDHPVLIDQTSQFRPHGLAYEESAARELHDLCNEATHHFSHTMAAMFDMPRVIVPDFALVQSFCDPRLFAKRGPNLTTVRLDMRGQLRHPDFQVDMIATAASEENAARSLTRGSDPHNACTIALLFTYIPLI